PQPVAGSWTTSGWSGPEFSLTTHVAGGPTPNAILPGLMGQVGEFVHQLQAIPTRGFGPLVDRADHPVAGATDLTIGMLARFGDVLWPTGPRPLGAHPALTERPGLIAGLRRHGPDVAEAMGDGPFVLVH